MRGVDCFYNAQIETFFQGERSLPSTGLNPKLVVDIAFITNVEDLFGKCSKLHITNTFLNLDARKDLIDLYSKIYRSQAITNNKFSRWLVKDYIANQKKKNVNCALAAWTTTLQFSIVNHSLLLSIYYFFLYVVQIQLI